MQRSQPARAHLHPTGIQCIPACRPCACRIPRWGKHGVRLVGNHLIGRVIPVNADITPYRYEFKPALKHGTVQTGQEVWSGEPWIVALVRVGQAIQIRPVLNLWKEDRWCQVRPLWLAGTPQRRSCLAPALCTLHKFRQLNP